VGSIPTASTIFPPARGVRDLPERLRPPRPAVVVPRARRVRASGPGGAGSPAERAAEADRVLRRRRGAERGSEAARAFLTFIQREEFRARLAAAGLDYRD